MRSLVASLQRLYWLMAMLLGATLFLLAPMIAEHWLRPKDLDPAYVANALRWMALAVTLQWPTFLYANCISGLQRQTLLNAVQVVASIGRFPGTLLMLTVWSPTLDVYFFNQSCVSFAQTGAVMFILWRILPTATGSEIQAGIEWKSLRTFAGGVGSISVLNLALTQYDKLLLSTMLPLKDFGYYAQAAALVGGLGIVALPIGGAVFPRFTQLVATQATAELREIYHHSMQLMAALLLPISVTLITFADVALYVWTGNEVTAQNAANVLRLLTVAMTIYGLLILPNNLQYAHGQTRLLFWIYIVAIAVYVPFGYAMARWAGGEGAAAALCTIMGSMFLFGVPFVHARLMPGDIMRWYLADIALPLAPVLALNVALMQIGAPTTRFNGGVMLIIAVVVGTVAALSCTPMTWHWLRRKRSAEAPPPR